MSVGGRDADEKGQSVRVRQDVHPGTRLTSVHGARTCVFAPFFGAHVSGVEDHSRHVDEARVVELMEDRFVEPAPDSGPRPDHEPTMGCRLRDPEARRQSPPGTPAHQHVDDRREQRLIRRVLRPATLRPYLRRRDQRLGDLPQPVRNNPTPRTPPHEQPNGQAPLPRTTRSPPGARALPAGGRSPVRGRLARGAPARVMSAPLAGSFGPGEAGPARRVLWGRAGGARRG